MNKSHGLMISRVHPLHLGKNPDEKKRTEKTQNRESSFVIS